MTKNASKKVSSTKPPQEPVKSVQYDLFSEFLSNDPSEVSNTVEIWESIPKYFFTPKQIEKLRTSDGLAKPYKWHYHYNHVPCEVKIQPALIEQEDGSYKAFFPGITEELVEEALKKILSDQKYGFHDPDNSQTWVRFSLSMLRKELDERGRGRTVKAVKHAISVMSKCIITVSQHNKEIWSGAILQDLVTVGRQEYLEDADAHHVARLPLFISQSINHLEYRQFNYYRFMDCAEQLSRWLYKRLINQFRQASLMTNYHCLFSGLKESGLLQQKENRFNRRKVISALDELKEYHVILSYTAEERKEGRKIIDVKYTIIPTPEFVKEQKAANKRHTDGKSKLSRKIR